MRTLTASLIALFCLCVGADSVTAFTLWIEGESEILPADGHAIGEKFTLRLYLDADQPGIQLLGIGVLFDGEILQYNPKPNASVGVPSYLLYGMSGMTTSSLYAAEDPWALWPGATPPGLKQVNVDWVDPTFNGTFVTGFGLKIAELEFQLIGSGDGIGEIDVSLSAGGNVFLVNGHSNTPIALRYTPEPTTALLLCLGLSGLALARSASRAGMNGNVLPRVRQARFPKRNR